MLGVGILLDLMLKLGIKAEIMERSYVAVFGLICFIILMIVGHTTDHRTFTHTLLYTLITGICMYLILPEASGYYMLGCLLHLLLDMLNNPFHNHGIWLFYPIKGKGIALGLCKAARIGNKVFYFVAIIAYTLIAAIYVSLDISVWRALPIMIITAYMIIAMHFVRVKSEREQRHIMHMHGEL